MVLTTNNLFKLHISKTLGAEDGRPSTLCYICCSWLRTCLTFYNMYQQSEKLFRDILYGLQVQEALGFNFATRHNLSVTTIPPVSINDFLNDGSTQVTVKKETTVVELDKTEQNDIETEDLMEIKQETLKHTQVSVKKETTDVELDKTEQNYILTEDLILIHTGEKPYACNRCIKAFNQKNKLTLHMLIHTGRKAYACNRCDKAFNQKSDLTLHMLIHTGEKSYACNRCDKAFYQKCNLTRHMLIHTGEKHYACNTCDKAFNQKGDLTRHMLIHTRKKPYACNRCDKAFIQKSDLTRHMLIHTGQKHYACNTCDKAFIQKSGLVLRPKYNLVEGILHIYIIYIILHMLIHTKTKPTPKSHA